MIFIRPALLFVALVATPALAETSQPSGQPVETQAEKKVCRVSATTGSIMRTRVCKTKAEWALIDEMNAEQAARAMDSRRTTGRVEGY